MSPSSYNSKPYRPRSSKCLRKDTEFGPARTVPHSHLSGKCRWLVRLPDGTTQYEHILVWEKVHGCKLPKGFVVHHLDGEPMNNAPENLYAMEAGEHIRLHRFGKYPSTFTGADGNLYRRCLVCEAIKPITEFPSNGCSKAGTPTCRPQCRPCERERKRRAWLRKQGS